MNDQSRLLLAFPALRASGKKLMALFS